MTSQTRYTSRDLESMPDDGNLYEIIDGELFVSTQPHYYHQLVCANLAFVLVSWSRQTSNGQVSVAPGLIFAEDDDVAPDIVWLSNERLQSTLAADGKLHSAPELVVEVLSPGRKNERRDRQAKLKLYSRRGVDEYWIVNWQLRQIEVYRRGESELELAVTLSEPDSIDSPLLSGFSCPLASIFDGVPTR